jgi:hypothetical protein
LPVQEAGVYTQTITVTGEKPGGFNIQARVEPAFGKPTAAKPAGNDGNSSNTANGAQPGGNNQNGQTANGNSGNQNGQSTAGNTGNQSNPAGNTSGNTSTAAATPAATQEQVKNLGAQLQQQQQQLAAQLTQQLQQQQQQQAQQTQQMAASVADLQRRAQAIQQMTDSFTNDRVDAIARRLRRTMNQQNTQQTDSDRVVNAVRDMLMQSAQRNQQQQGGGGQQGGGQQGGWGQQGGQQPPGGPGGGQMSDEQMQMLASKLEETLRTRLSADVAAKVTADLRSEMNRPMNTISLGDYDYERPYKEANNLDSSQFDNKLALFQQARDICRLALADSGRTAPQREQDRKFMMLLAGKFRQLQNDATDSDTRKGLDRDITTCLSMSKEEE